MSCPVCGEETAQRYRPFCSKRCADIDLGKWLSGGYVISQPGSDPAGEAEEIDESPPPLKH